MVLHELASFKPFVFLWKLKRKKSIIWPWSNSWISLIKKRGGGYLLRWFCHQTALFLPVCKQNLLSTQLRGGCFEGDRFNVIMGLTHASVGSAACFTWGMWRVFHPLPCSGQEEHRSEQEVGSQLEKWMFFTHRAHGCKGLAKLR